MYLPKHFHEPNTSVMQDFMRAHPLAAVITLNDNRIEANHIPLMVFNDPLPYGVLQGHIARANPIWYEHPTDSEVLTIFQGIESYISPSWYASKQETGKVVPTWNYVSVHARGKLRVIDDAHWLRHHLESMVSHHEKKCKHAPWKLTDAPDDFIAMQIKSIIGIEIHSGRNRIVRRIFESLGYDVKGLDRVMYANLTKKNVERSKWRYLSDKEIRLLKYMNNSKNK